MVFRKEARKPVVGREDGKYGERGVGKSVGDVENIGEDPGGDERKGI